MDLREQNFGIEIEMTGITRNRAAQVVADYFGTYSHYDGGGYDAYHVMDNQNRKWKIMSDASIMCQRKIDNRKVVAGREYSVELVSPICTYNDIEKIQEIVRALRGAGAFANASVGIHIHINAAPFEAKQLRNLVNIVAAKEDMIYRALQVESRREQRYCRKIDTSFLERLNREKPTTREHLKNIWYNGDDGSYQHYHDSRYHCLNLHSVFQKGTIEFRAFNSGDTGSKGSIHAGKIKAYIQFCMAITAQAYNQKYASPTKTVSENEKYTFRVWLLRLGMIGDEFKTARTHLLNHLDGNIAWKDPAQAIAQRERLRKKQEEELDHEQRENISKDVEQEQSQEDGPVFSMSMTM
ncbi:amidoligase family protein [Robinsoniella peoriensis]|uniref:amidoligase family protein n=1 Tax=Robinsoniella peoriensis TaxID=180332 RepID=UPI00363BB9CF|nr:amidoligase family protein [Oscillospiraceae bacterium]